MLKKRFGDLLLEQRLLTDEQLQVAFKLQKQSGKRLTELLVEVGFLSEEELLKFMEQHLGIPRINLEHFFVSPSITRLIPEFIAKKHLAFPVKIYDNVLVLAINDPLNIFAIDDIKMVSGYDVQVVLASKAEIENAINRHYSKRINQQTLGKYDKVLKQHSALEFDTIISDELGKAPVIRLVDTLIQQAVEKNASDIHIEPQENFIRIRYRIDGVLSEVMSSSKDLLSSITARIKIMAGMDITQKRIPQDGHIEIKIKDQIVDIRVSTLPTIHGEKVVLRILNRQRFLLSLDSLGFNCEQVDRLYQMINYPYGLILVTGPTGSGKTTTLYSMLNAINSLTKNIITLEDPVEYSLPGINQVQINTKAGITFSSGLRAILRQDPNVIMVGEIRDSETAEIAIRAALTGHLVFSTLHTNTASGAITRLLDMGIEPYLLAACIIGIISQRLVRKICSNCKKEYVASSMERTLLQIENEDLRLYHGVGCNYCNQTGYFQRTAIGEIVYITSAHRRLISEQASAQEFDAVSRRMGYKSMLENGIDLVLQGTTSLDELKRMIYNIENM